jgi:uncharacterized protein involved in outer membrane biogenesis
MRKWIIAAAVCAVLAAALGVALLNLDTYIEGNRERLTREAEAALGRPLRFDALDLCVLCGVGVTVDNVRVEEDSATESGDFARIDQVRISPKLLPLLLGRFEIRRVLFDHPTVDIARRPTGLNISPTGNPADAEARRPPANAAMLRQRARTLFADSPLSVSARIIAGEIRYHDQTAATAGDLTVGGIDLRAATRGELPNLGFEVSLDATRAEVSYGVTAKGTDETSTSVTRLGVQAAVSDMHLGRLLGIRLREARMRIAGSLDADLALQGSGDDSGSVRRALRGNGQLEIRDITVKNLNVAESILSGLTGIEGLSSLVSEQTRNRYPGIFRTGDTFFDALHATVGIAEGCVTTENLAIEAQGFDVVGRGSFRLDNHVDVGATLIAGPKLTADIIADFKPARYLVRKDHLLHIPFKIRGQFPSARLRPDNRRILEALRGGRLGKQLDELLGSREGDRDPGRSGKEAAIDKGSLRKAVESFFRP